jgi:hypothetical protein
LLVDIGWLFERMLEVIVMPNVINPPVEEGQGLVNFEKRRCDDFPSQNMLETHSVQDIYVTWLRMLHLLGQSLAKGDGRLASMTLLGLAKLSKRRATFNSTIVSFARTPFVKPEAMAPTQTGGLLDRSTSWFTPSRRSTNETGMLVTG